MCSFNKLTIGKKKHINKNIILRKNREENDESNNIIVSKVDEHTHIRTTGKQSILRTVATTVC